MVKIFEVRITTRDGYTGYRVIGESAGEALTSICENDKAELKELDVIEIKVSLVQL